MPRRVPTYRPGPSAQAVRAQYERQGSRREDIRFYQSPAWRALRAAKLAEQPLCEPCLARGDLTPAVHVHHKLERKQRPDLALDWDNLESACIPCHNAKRKAL